MAQVCSKEGERRDCPEESSWQLAQSRSKVQRFPSLEYLGYNLT